jgi:coenzyme F420-reducing hydrogenase beta subunit
MPAGYSNIPLLKKLGLKPEIRLLVLHAPENYLVLLEKDISTQLCARDGHPDIIHLFAKSRKIFYKEMKELASYWKANPAISIWVSWYKKSSGIATDITETDIRNYALQNGLVDVKVCAVTEHWSGLKLVVPLAKR